MVSSRRRVAVRPLYAFLCGAGLLWSLHAAAPRADDAATAEAVAEADPRAEFVDHSFDAYASLDDIESAVASGDAELLTDVALQIAHGESVLHRPRKGITAEQLLRGAIQASAEEQDQDSLARIEKCLQERGRAELEPVLAAARQLASSARKLETPPGLDPSEASVESMVLYHAMSKEIQKAQRYGMPGDVENIVASLEHLPLHKKQRDHLSKLADQALVAIKADAPADPTFGKLAMASRFLTAYPRLVAAPSLIKFGASAKGAVVLMRPVGSNTTVKLSASGLSVPTTVTIPKGKVAAEFSIKAPAKSSAAGTTIYAQVGNSRVSRSIRFAK